MRILWPASLVAAATVGFVIGVLRAWQSATGSNSVGEALDTITRATAP